MDPMETVRKELDAPATVSLIETRVHSGQWLWVEDPAIADIWYLMDGETRLILACVYTGEEDVEVSDKLMGMTE